MTVGELIEHILKQIGSRPDDGEFLGNAIRAALASSIEVTDPDEERPAKTGFRRPSTDEERLQIVIDVLIAYLVELPLVTSTVLHELGEHGASSAAIVPDEDPLPMKASSPPVEIRDEDRSVLERRAQLGARIRALLKQVSGVS